MRPIAITSWHVSALAMRNECTRGTRVVKRHHFNDNKGLEQVEKLATVETRCVVKRFSCLAFAL